MRTLIKGSLYAVVIITIGLLLGYSTTNAQSTNGTSKIKNVILVHGAFVDGSGWKGVYDILTKNGYHTVVVQIPLTSLKDDADVVKRALDKLDGPAVLVGHSWGGTVITEVSADPKVASLVYVTAFQPDQGENTIKWVSSAPALPENGILPPDNEGLVYYDRQKFHAGFAADLSKEQAIFMADSQKPIAASSFATPVSVAAWHDKPSFAIVPTADKSINPVILRNMYKRSGAKTTEIKGGSHAVFVSHPKEVADVIISATK
ncbi:Pimeloyl-ACP methyl ester carboxylesterase [Chitinophaga sp. CF118]|uniref:alpha/beta hydrolase n=1 Tax=Chitinophaga sp. CF118 TaxID=1884367 RepID=UPI0008F016E3|nr:alpha/beta hydrolase [Chitinophaga sp. CF118]SFD97910.1 Pimeloyl-ACP methyl ester carboxylesterase [Chitinophaga sp. CF118]